MARGFALILKYGKCVRGPTECLEDLKVYGKQHPTLLRVTPLRRCDLDSQRPARGSQCMCSQ